jgi:hypothetical protein
MPVVYVRQEVEKSMQGKIKDIIKRHQGSITGLFDCLLANFDIYCN